MTTLSTPTTTATFPAGTADTPWTFLLSGTNPDGSAYSSTTTDTSPTTLAPSDLQVGAVITLVVMKNGIASLPSDAYTVVSQTVTLTVPDAAQKATISAS